MPTEKNNKSKSTDGQWDKQLSVQDANEGLRLQDFYSYMLMHQYIFVRTGELWPPASVNARVAPVMGPDGKPIKASAWLDEHRAVEQTVWAPGAPMVVEDRLMVNGAGWIDSPGTRCFNTYRPPSQASGDASLASPWVDHVRRIYPEEADHLIRWFAHRIQCPGDKVNHACVLGGNQGIGKDSMLEPVKRAVGEWNVSDVSPQMILASFNGFVKSVMLCVSEAHNLGDFDRESFYEHMKTFTAAPPHSFRCNEKFVREYNVLNVCGVIITTNYKTNGIYLPADDRRHFVAWSPASKEDFHSTYFRDLYEWYQAGGHGHVAAFLRSLDLSGFDPKAPPPKTQAFWEMVQADQSSEDAELADTLDRLGRPDVVTISTLIDASKGLELAYWLQHKSNRRQIPHRLETARYVQVRNAAAPADGLWRIRGKRQAVYARKDLSARARLAAAEALCHGGR